MATATKKPSNVTLNDVRLSFPKLFKAEASTPTSSPKFSAAFLIDPETPRGKANIAEIERVIRFVTKRDWGDKAEGRLRGLEWNRQPLRDGSKGVNQDGEQYNGYAGMKFVTASSHPNARGERKHKLYTRNLTEITEDDGTFYGGCYVDVVLDIYTVASNDKGGTGVFASIELVRKRRDGESFGSGPLNPLDHLELLDDEDEDDDLV